MAVVGLRLGYDFAERVGVEVSYGRSWLRNDAGDLASHLYHAVLRYRLVDTGSWAVHLAAGGGGVTYRPGTGGSRSLSDPTVAGGVGASYFLTPGFAVRTDLDFLGQFCRDPEPRPGLVCNDGSQLGYTQLTAGLRFPL